MKPYAVSICCHLTGGHAVHRAYLFYGKSAKDVAEHVSLNIQKYIDVVDCMKSAFVTLNINDSNGDTFAEAFNVPLENHLVYCVN